MDQLWLGAPALAIKVRGDAEQVEWLANPALLRWAQPRGVSPTQWRDLAQALLAQATSPGPSDAAALAFAGERFRATPLPLDAGWVVWLEPAPYDAGESRGGSWLAGMLDAAEEFARLGVFVRDLRTGVGRWSPHMFRMFGLPYAEQAPPPEVTTQLLHPDDRERVNAEFLRVIRTPGRYENRFRIVRTDGEVRALHGFCEVKAGSDGRPEWMVGVSIDDTEVFRKMQLHEALTARLTQAVNLASVWLWRVDVATQRVEFNDVGYRALGLQPRDGGVPLEAVREMIHPDDIEAITRAAEQALASDGIVDVEARYRDSSGGYRHWLTRRVAERDAEGRAIALAGVSIDQTARINERERARSLVHRIDIITQAAGVGVWSIDIERDTVEWNEQMFHIYGLPVAAQAPSPQELMERLIHPDDRALVARQRARAERFPGLGIQFECRIVRPDGALRWLSSWSRREHAPDGRLMAYGVTLDVTEGKRAEQALRDKASAEQASRAKSEFLSRMSHELRTPLNAVLGFAQLLLHDAADRLNERQSDRVQRIHAAGLHLTALIDDVLDLASIESNTLKLDMQEVSLQDAVDDVLQWTRAQAERAGVRVHAAALPGWVRSDPRRLRQILANLLSNAIKYNRPDGEVWIACRAQPVAGKDGWLLSVRDSGRGLSAAQQAHLFEPFNRLGAEREAIEGTGIGLTIVHHLVELMGGTIEVDSDPGHGSEFRVALPAGAALVPARLAEAGETSVAAPAPAATLSVLYIEDNAVNVLLVEQLLTLRPHMKLLSAADGTSGVALARAARPGVVLIDMQLPDFDGYEVLRRLRAEPGLAGCALIALSASAMPEDVSRARAAGFHDYWTKPIDFTQFLESLDALAAGAPS